MSQLTVESMRRACEHAVHFIERLDGEPVASQMGLDELSARFGGELSQKGTDAIHVIDDLVGAARGGLLGSTGGRFFAWVIGGVLPSALAADWLASTWNQNAALYACSPAAAVVEEVAGEWLRDLLGLPAGSSFAFTSGCQMAHFVGLAAARYEVLRMAGWDVHESGLFGAPRLRVLVSDQRHASVDRALRYLGFGRQSTVALKTNPAGEVSEPALRECLEQEVMPTIVVLNAADLNLGAVDCFEKLVPLAHAHGAWVHVDGAFGLFARASRAKRELLRGVEAADSWAMDAHKWLNTPFDCGVAFVRDSRAHQAAFSVQADYIAPAKAARDQIAWNPEWSRRARGFAVYAALRELGRDGIETLIDRSCDHARAIVDGIGSLPGAEILFRPTLNQGLVRFLDNRPGAVEADHDGRTRKVIAAVNDSGEAFFSATNWRGSQAMRVSVINWRTTAGDVRRAIAACARVIELAERDGSNSPQEESP
jgi:glutamate/tyrosine decarboxylase-like PLP-dependent enzyme